MSFYRSALVGLGILAMSSAASAADRMGYLSLSGGAAFASSDVEESDVTNMNGTPLSDDTFSLDTGYFVAPAIGFYVDNFRFEFQYTGQANDINGLDEANGLTHPDFDGRLHSNLFMLNAYYDIPVADRLSVYVGAGAGADYITFEGDTETQDPRLAYTIDNQTGTGFAYQVMVGLEYRVTPMLSVFGGYRGWTTLDIDTQTSTMETPWFHLAEIGLRLSI